MAINDNRTFGSLRTQSPAPTSTAGARQRDPSFVASRYWLNFGVLKTFTKTDYATGEVTTEQRFCSPFGIPLDSFKSRSTSNEGEIKNKQNKVENEIAEKLIAAARQLAPGQKVIIPGTILGMQIQLRHRNEDKIEQLTQSEDTFVPDLGIDIAQLLAQQNAA